MRCLESTNQAMKDYIAMFTESIISQKMLAKVPEKLYHYTNSTGLIGILTSGKIWTTKIHYLNDKSEIQLAFKYIRAEIESQRNGHLKTRTDEELDIMVEVLDIVEEINISVASFTAKGDQLSQWRGYGNIGNGYSLGLYGQELMNTAKNNKNYHLVPCVYDEQEHLQMIKELVDTAPVINVKKNPAYSRLSLYQTTFGDAALILAAMIKSVGFVEEEEWRLISPTLPYSDAKFRQGNHTLIPYWEYDLDLDRTLESVIVGPTPEAELSEKAISGLLANAFPNIARLWTSSLSEKKSGRLEK